MFAPSYFARAYFAPGFWGAIEAAIAGAIRPPLPPRGVLVARADIDGRADLPARAVMPARGALAGRGGLAGRSGLDGRAALKRERLDG